MASAKTASSRPCSRAAIRLMSTLLAAVPVSVSTTPEATSFDSNCCCYLRRRNPWSGRIFIVPALLPQFIEAWSLTNTQAEWLAGSVSAGYMLAVIPFVSLTDRRPARHIAATVARSD
jgi:hypothetical protein